GDGIRDFHVTGVQTCALQIYDEEHGNHVKLGRKTETGASGTENAGFIGFPCGPVPVTLTEYIRQAQNETYQRKYNCCVDHKGPDLSRIGSRTFHLLRLPAK